MSTGSEPIRVLHVDDESAFGDLTAQFLEKEDDRFKIITESGAPAALKILEDESIDCIVSDLTCQKWTA